MLITFANSLDPDQDRHLAGPDLGPNSLTLTVFLREFIEKVNFEEKSADVNKSMKNMRGSRNFRQGGSRSV